jgi:hypothetical protein
MFTLDMALLAWLLLLPLRVVGGRGQPGSGELRGEPGEFLSKKTSNFLRHSFITGNSNGR